MGFLGNNSVAWFSKKHITCQQAMSEKKNKVPLTCISYTMDKPLSKLLKILQFKIKSCMTTIVL